VMNEVRNHFGEKVYETTIPRNVRVSEAPSMGTPVVFLDPHSKGAQAYKAFGWEFMAKNPTRFELPKAVETAPVSVPPPAEPVVDAAASPRQEEGEESVSEQRGEDAASTDTASTDTATSTDGVPVPEA